MEKVEKSAKGSEEEVDGHLGHLTHSLTNTQTRLCLKCDVFLCWLCLCSNQSATDAMKLMCLSTVDDDGGSGGGAVSFQLAAALTDTSIALSTSLSLKVTSVFLGQTLKMTTLSLFTVVVCLQQQRNY